MWGYIVNFYKYATFPSSLKPDMRDYLNQQQKEDNSGSLLVFGDYDRLSVERIDQFQRFRDVDHYAQRWMGPRQSVLLYRLSASAAYSLPGGAADLLELFRRTDKKPRSTQRSFLVFTMVTLDPRLHKCRDFGRVLEHCCQLISTQVNRRDVTLIQPEQLSYQVYGSFSSSELVIVWYVDQYVDALRLTDMLRYASFVDPADRDGKRYILPFVSLYSIIAQDRDGRSDLTAWRIPRIEGSAELRFSFQDGVRDAAELERFLYQDLREKLCQGDEGVQLSCGYRNAGIYDYSIRMPAFLLCDPGRGVFRRSEFLHWDQDHVSKYFSLTHVQLYYEMDHEQGQGPSSVSQSYPDLDPAFPDAKGTLRQHVELIRKMVYGPEQPKEEPSQSGVPLTGAEMLDAYRKWGLRYVIKKVVPSTDGLCDSLDLLYSDFVNNCSNLTNSAWAEDLTTQFIAIIDYIASQFCLYCMGEKDGLFSNIKSVCEIYIQMIYHIAQSRRTVFIVPSCHLRYMGQYDMILHAYYGWVKCLLDLAYSLPHKNGVQHTLIPVLTVDVIPEIRVSMYTVYNHFVENDPVSSIFSINLPLSAMTDFLRYSMTICHEAAHLIIPHDRERRNQVMGMLFFSEFMANLVLSELQLKLLNDQEGTERIWWYGKVLNDIKRGFMLVAYNGLRPYYIESLHAAVMDRLRDKEPTWEYYRSELIYELGSLVRVEAAIVPLIRFMADNRAVLQEVISHCVGDLACWNTLGGTLDTGDAGKMCQEISAAIDEALCAHPSTRAGTLVQKYKHLLNLLRWRGIYHESLLISSAYREASQDLFMIRIFGLAAEDYLVFLDRHRHDSGWLEDSLPQTESLRVSMVCDYLLTPEFQEGEAPRDAVFTLSAFDQLGPRYVELFMSVPEMRSQTEKDPSACRDRLQKCFLAARERLEQYYTNYEFVRSLLLLQMRDADVLRCSDDEIRAKVAHAKMDASYAAWKAAVTEKKASPGGYGETISAKHRVFENQVELIHRFQTQETLKDLSTKLRERDDPDGKA